ncbi:hypothetical protein, partial [Zooshikella harenae]
YQDPRVINPLLNASTSNEQAKLLGPIDKLWVPNHYRPALFRETSSKESHAVIKDELEREWVIWQNPQTWHGQFPEERPWFEFSAKQWEGIMAEHKHKVEEAIALYLMEENPAFKKLKPQQLHDTIRYWCDKSDDYNISKTKQVARLILVVTEFGPDIPKREWVKLEQDILFNTDFSEHEKIQRLEKYNALVYEKPGVPFDPIKCIVYEQLYQDFGIKERIDPFNKEDLIIRMEFLERYNDVKPDKPLLQDLVSKLYEQHSGMLMDQEKKLIPLSYIDNKDAAYRAQLLTMYQAQKQNS